MKIKDLKDELKWLSNKQKDDLILNLFKNFKDVKTFLAVKYWEWVKEILFNEVKEKIKTEFDMKYINSRWRFSVAKKNISDYKKVTEDINWTIKLYIFYLNILADFMDEVWSWEQIADSFYNTFNQTVKLINSWWYWKKLIGDMKNISRRAQNYWRWVDAVSDLLEDIIF
jgi:hypothetical protein